MSALHAALLLALQSPAVEQATEAGRLAEAWELAAGNPDPVARALDEAWVRTQAGDPAGALAAAERGLALAPADLRLLHRAVASGVWLGLAEPTARYARRLEAAVEEAPLDAGERDAWRASAAGLRAEAEGLAAAAARCARAVRRARGVSVALLGLCALALAALWLTGGRADRSGSPRR